MTIEQQGLIKKKIEISPEILKKLDELPCVDGERVLFILTVRGLKPASEVLFNMSLSFGKMSYPEVRSSFEKICESLNLKFKSLPEFEKPDKFIRYTISFNEDKLEQIYDEYLKDNFHYLKSSKSGNLGKLLGFPETSVEAYTKGNEYLIPLNLESGFISQEFIPEDILSQEFMAFLEFRLSRENWRDELEVLKTWASEIKLVHPELYKRIVGDYLHRRQRVVL